MSRIAFLGLGAMGSRMAGRLLGAGHDVTLWNRSPDRAAALVERGARRADTPRAAAEGAEVAISMVRDDEAASAVWLDAEVGALAGLTHGAVAVECSTTTPEWARSLHAVCDGQGVGCLDAPVVGSRPQAEAGALIFLAGGDTALCERLDPLLRLMGAAVHSCGGPGAGATVKLLVNAMLAFQVAGLAELLATARRAGLDPSRVAEIVATTPVASPAAKANAGGMLSGQFAPLFPAELIEKDLGYTVGLAGGAEHAPLVAAAREVFGEAIRRGLGSENMTGVIRLYA